MSGSEEPGALRRLVRRSSSWGLGVRLLLLAGVLLAAWPILALATTAAWGVSTWFAAALAALVCGAGAALALTFTAWLRGPHGARSALLFGMLFRMGLPLALGLELNRRFAELERAGFFGLVLGFYLVALVAETLLVLPLVQESPAAPAAKVM